MRYAQNRVSRGTDLVVGVEDIKRHLHIEHCEDDDYIRSLILDATDLIERETGRVLVESTYTLKLDHFPVSTRYHHIPAVISLPGTPLISVASITYYTTDSVTTTYTDYVVVAPDDSEGYIAPTTWIWPCAYPRPLAVTIAYTAGGNPPQNAAHAIRLLCGAWYESREAESDRRTYPTSIGLDRLLNSFRVVGGQR